MHIYFNSVGIQIVACRYVATHAQVCAAIVLAEVFVCRIIILPAGGVFFLGDDERSDVA